jgi:hypothetical protein
MRFMAMFSVSCASGQRAQRHARRHEALADLGDRLDLVDRHRLARVLKSSRSRSWIGGMAPHPLANTAIGAIG